MPKGPPIGYERPNAACPMHAAQIREWAAQALSLCEIGRRVGTSHWRVRQYMTRHGIPYLYKHSVGKNNPSWTGGRILDKDGYVLIWCPDHPNANSGGYVREHRLVMEKILGRFLQPQEVVHHKDDTPDGRQNNAPLNLQLYGTNTEHLAETLAGKVPKWTKRGWDRMQAGYHQGLGKWHAANGHTIRHQRGRDGRYQQIDDPALPEPIAQTQG